MDQQSPNLLRPPWLQFARLVWLLLVSASVAMFLLALQPRFEQILTDPYGMRPGLEAMGLTVWHFAVYGTVLDILVAIGFTGFAVLLFARRSQEWMALLFSLAIGMFIVDVLPVTTVLPEINPAWRTPQLLLSGLGFAALSAALLLFPDGRFVPRWTRVGLIALVIYGLLWPVFPGIAPISSLDFRVRPRAISALAPIALFILLVVIQVYRYRIISTPTQRQQTRWVVLGVSGVLVALSLMILPGIFWEPIRTNPLIYTRYYLIGIPVVLFSMLLIPLTLAIAILRHRLWDIDLVIRRSLSYGILTASLAALYLSAVTLLQAILTTISGQSSELAIVLSTLAIAALFNPLRRRIQGFIDRRFYRQKYDAEQALAKFAEASRSETDMTMITTALVATVQTAIQPERISVWMRVAGNSPTLPRPPVPPSNALHRQGRGEGGSGKTGSAHR